jgi:glucose-6-phosphate isomerase, archaeal
MTDPVPTPSNAPSSAPSNDASLAPFTTLLDLATGAFTPPRGEVVERRLADLRDAYEQEPAEPDRVAYRVFLVDAPPTNANLICSTTVLEPGDVAGEYFMTKGHFHRVRDRAEVYLGLAGDGRLLMATEDGRWQVEPIRAGTLTYVPGGWAHRSVNVGAEPLVFFAAYVGDAGHDYEAVARRGFPVRVVRGADEPSIIENTRYGG